jgi:integrase
VTIRKRKLRDGTSRLFIEIRYRTIEGRHERYRRDAQIQTKGGAEAEHRRLVTELSRAGTLRHISVPVIPEKPVHVFTFNDAARHFRATRLGTLKPSTQFSYETRLDNLLVPRFGGTPLAELTGEMLAALDADLAADGLKASTRQKPHIVFRSVVRLAVAAGMLEAMPKLPRIPRVGRKMVRPFHRDDLDAILAKSSPHARLAFALGAFAGLRAGEVRGLRWTDIDLKGNTLTVRRALTRGEETTPKSGDQRVVPIAAPLRLLLEAAEPKRSSPWASVAVTAFGKPWGESGLNQTFKRAQQRAGRSGLCFHDLRHYPALWIIPHSPPLH